MGSTKPASKSGYKSRHVAGIAPAVGSATLPQGSLYAVAVTGCSLLEASFIRAGAVAAITGQFVRLTTLGTPGTANNTSEMDDDAPSAECLAFVTHSVAPTLGTIMHRFRLPTSAGTGVWYTFHDEPVEVPIGTANGVGFLPVTPSGGADVTFVWEE